MASSEWLATMAVPLYRLEQDFARIGARYPDDPQAQQAAADFMRVLGLVQTSAGLHPAADFMRQRKVWWRGTIYTGTCRR